MKRLILLAILIVAAPAALAGAGPAAAADDMCACYDPPPPPPPPLPPPPPPPPPPAPPTADETLAPGGSGGWDEETYTDGWQYMTSYRSGGDMTAPAASYWLASGCRKVRAWHTGHSLLGRTLYRFHQVKRWCWRYPHITSMTISIDITDVDNCCIRFDGLVEGASQTYYYSWKAVADGGHFSYRKGQLGNCILRYGCLSTYYPWVQIWVNGNGAWKGEHGVS